MFVFHSDLSSSNVSSYCRLFFVSLSHSALFKHKYVTNRDLFLANPFLLTFSNGDAVLLNNQATTSKIC
jgi:hypothetical protein